MAYIDLRYLREAMEVLLVEEAFQYALTAGFGRLAKDTKSASISAPTVPSHEPSRGLLPMQYIALNDKKTHRKTLRGGHPLSEVRTLTQLAFNARALCRIRFRFPSDAEIMIRIVNDWTLNVDDADHQGVHLWFQR